jgi:hypothetical protein
MENESKKDPKEYMAQFKEKRTSMIKEYEETNPDSLVAKRLIFRLLSIIVISNLVFVILSVAYPFINGVHMPVNDIFIRFMPVLWVFAFSSRVYKIGSIPSACLIILAGALSLIFVPNYVIILLHGLGDFFFNMLTILGIIIIGFQIFAMLFILFEKKCKLYMSAMAGIYKDLKIWSEENRPR